jgi:DNA polymerase
MTDQIGVDFETRSALELPDVGAYVYATHPSTHPICAAFVDGATGAKALWRPGLPAPSFATPERRYVAHNAGFDRLVWHHHFDAPLPPLENWECSAVRMAINGYPRNLDDASYAVLGSYAKDPAEAKALTAMMRVKAGKVVDTPELRALVESRCMTDVDIMMQLIEKTLDPTPEQMTWWRFDQRCNARGIPVALDDIKRMLVILGEVGVSGVYEHARRRLLAATDFMIGSPTQTARLKQWLLESEGLRLDSLAKDVVEQVLVTDQGMSPRARRALEIKSAIGGAAPKKFAAFAARAQADPKNPGRGWIRDAYVCNGAHTGRDSAKGAQMQNLKRVTAGPHELAMLLAADADDKLDFMIDIGIEPLELAGKCVRPMIQAMPGHKLVVGDFSKIETCVLFWVAGETRGLELLRSGQDIYCDLASKIKGYEVTKDMHEERQLGKQGILLLGYGGGEDKFAATCLKQHGMYVTPADALRTKTVYRETYRAVPRFWWGLEGAVRECIVGKTAKRYGCLQIAANEDLLTIRLPSGRKLRYRNPRVSKDNDISFTGAKGDSDEYKGWGTVHTYGGKLTENVVQAIAHDLQREAALQLDDAGFDICIRSHDELGAHVDESLIDAEWFTSIMELPLAYEGEAWWSGIPIKVETKVMDRYTK